MASMNISWKESEEPFIRMEQIYLALGKQAISMNHYDFAEASRGQGIVAQAWKEFLADPRVRAYVDAEFEAIKASEFKKIIVDINSSRSIGQAQIINSLAKMQEAGEDLKKGPAFVYCYIPPSENQLKAENVEVLTDDPFRNS